MRLVRSGTTLVELVVALALGGVVIGLIARSSLQQRRTERASAATRSATVAVDEATWIVAALLERTSLADSLVPRGDTAMDWRAFVGTAVACAARGDSVIVPDSGAAVWWEGVPTTGDVVDVGTAGGDWLVAHVTAVRSRAGGGACGAPHQVLVLDQRVDSTTVPLVRVTRWRRVTLYRGGDAQWWLGERRCDAVPVFRCDPAQPLTGPLGPPPSGLTFTVGERFLPARSVGVGARSGSARRSRAVAVPP